MQALELFASGDPLSLTRLLINLAIGVGLAVGLRWHFNRFASTLSNRGNFSHVFPFILLTTTLIITVVKSSLALSLGLVGALSIVRFRTPIKEPEELAYLFMAIAMGLGLGADQSVPTIVAGLGILVVVALLKRGRRESEEKSLFLSIRCPQGAQDALALESINSVLGKHVSSHDMRRVDTGDGTLEATFFLDVPTSGALVALMDELRQSFPGVNLTFIDQNRLPSV